MEGDAGKCRSLTREKNFNPLPPHGGRLEQEIYDTNTFVISIHSLRMEGDNPATPAEQRGRYFNPLPPHGGRLRDASHACSVPSFQSTPSAWRETYCNVHAAKNNVFQSTPSAWRETCTISPYVRIAVFQSTPSAWRETSPVCRVLRYRRHFNPLPPHGGRLDKYALSAALTSFQSTPSAWRETTPWTP